MYYTKYQTAAVSIFFLHVIRIVSGKTTNGIKRHRINFWKSETLSHEGCVFNVFFKAVQSKLNVRDSEYWNTRIKNEERSPGQRGL